KTAQGAVWLNAEQFSAYDFWQYWRNTEDGDVARFLKLFTTLPLGEIAKLEALGGAEINEAKKVLANEATALLHGRDAAEKAAATAQKTFEEGALAEDLPTISGAPGDGILALFVASGLCSSNGEVRRAVTGNSVSVNDKKITDPTYEISEADFNSDGLLKLSLGKKRHVLVKHS
ncbi:MAG: S4 domain-containing protein, partial [Anderseniella sp.]